MTGVNLFTKKNLVPCSLFPQWGIYCLVIRSLLSLHFSRLHALSLFPCVRFFSPFFAPQPFSVLTLAYACFTGSGSQTEPRAPDMTLQGRIEKNYLP